jgi:hypothetical protein
MLLNFFEINVFLLLFEILHRHFNVSVKLNKPIDNESNGNIASSLFVLLILIVRRLTQLIDHGTTSEATLCIDISMSGYVV